MSKIKCLQKLVSTKIIVKRKRVRKSEKDLLSQS